MKGLLLLVAALPLAADDAARSLGIFLEHSQALAGAALKEMKSEVDSRLRRTGLTLHWRAVEENRGKEAFDKLAVVSLKGRCIARPAGQTLDDALPFRKQVTLATTIVKNGQVLPYSEVDCDQIRSSLGSRISSFGRALGVVVAHELQHILQNTVGHAKVGWMRQALDWRDLTTRKEGQDLPPLP
jgi:hypothetical protein